MSNEYVKKLVHNESFILILKNSFEDLLNNPEHLRNCPELVEFL